jgi:hypothetical protein
VIFSGGYRGATQMILSKALEEEGFQHDGQRIEALRTGKGFGLLDQDAAKGTT